MSGRRYLGIHRGVVRRVIDDQRGRLILEVPDVYGPGRPSPPARMGAVGGGNQADLGACWIPTVGSAVWVFFEFGGNSATPVWFHGWGSAASGETDFAQAFQGNDDTGELPDRGGNIAVNAWDDEFQEPGAKRLGEYPDVRGWRSESGHVIIMDDTEDNEVVQVAHKDGSMIEWGPGGAELHKVKGSQYQVVNGTAVKHYHKDVEEVYEGSLRQTVNGDYTKKVRGSFNESRSGDIAEALEGALEKTFGGPYSKTLGSEARTVQNNRQLQVLGQELKAVAKDHGLTVGEFMSTFVGNTSGSPTDTAYAVSAQTGKVTMDTTGGVASMELNSESATLEGIQGNLKGTAQAAVDAPTTTIGPGASQGGGGVPIAKVGSITTGTASLGPINLSVNTTVTTGSAVANVTS